MEITTAMLCDFAQVREGLLFISSGGVTRCHREELPAPINVFMALVIELDRIEAQRPHSMRVHIADEDGREIADVNGTFEFGSAEMLLLEENPTIPIALDVRNAPVERYGPVQMSVYLDGEFRRSVTLHVMQSPEG
jgi:hypothetical protein